MLSVENTIRQRAFEYIPEQAVADQLAINARKLEDSVKYIPIRYHTRN